MPKFNLAEQLASTRYRMDDAEDLGELLETSDNQAVQRLVILPLAKLVEYKDDNFERTTGRTRATALCGLAGSPGIIRDIDDVEAAKIMLDTNLEQRHNLLYSEKAYAYRMRMELEGCQGKRTDLAEDGEKVDMLAEVGRKNKDNRRTVADLIRLTYLLSGLLKLVDEGTIGFKVGVQLSYLPAFAQSHLLDTIIPTIPYKKKIKPMQASVLREMHKSDTLTTDSMEEVFRKQKNAPASFSISGKKLSAYADLLNDKDEIERLFLEFLENYKSKRSA